DKGRLLRCHFSLASSRTKDCTLRCKASRRLASDSFSAFRSCLLSWNTRSETQKSKTELGVDILIDFGWVGIRRVDREVHRFFDFRRDFIFDFLKKLAVRHFTFLQPLGEQLYWIALGFPLFFLLFRAVVRAVDVADVMAVEAVSITL